MNYNNAENSTTYWITQVFVCLPAFLHVYSNLVNVVALTKTHDVCKIGAGGSTHKST